jgi:hypothetical protein
MLRIPGWVQSGYVEYGGERIELTTAEAMTHVAVIAQASEDMEIKIVLDMPARFTEAHPLVEECAGQIAVERGPLVYCMETPDAQVESLDQLILPADAEFEVCMTEIAGRQVPMLKTQALMRAPLGEALYRTYSQENTQMINVSMIPYYAWDNRGAEGEMKFWMPFRYRK